MALSELDVDGLGRVTIFRRKGLKYLRVSVGRDGSIRLSIPWYVPKSMGIKYLISKKEWIKKHRAASFSGWKDGQQLTEKYHLRLHFTDAKRTSSKKEEGKLTIFIPQDKTKAQSQALIAKQVKKFLKDEAEKYLPSLLNNIAREKGYRVKNIRIRSLKSRWGSCSHDKTITLNASLVQLPYELVEYVTYHELAHTKHLNHGKEFWAEVASNLPDYKERRKTLRNHNPAVIS